MPSTLLVARDLTKGHPATPEAYRALAEAHARARGRALVVQPQALIAYVNRGRWVADCPYCGSGIMLDPDWPAAYCLGAGCHRAYVVIVWPADRIAIEAALAVRPQVHQHWGYQRGVRRDALHRAESVDDLHRENDAHRDALAPVTRRRP